MPPELDGVLGRADVRRTGATIGVYQRPDGSIPWSPGDETDPWDHVEAAMGLDVAGFHREAERAYAWLREVQRADGSWAARYRGRRITDPATDANLTAYVAVGTWHHHLATGDGSFLVEMWDTVRRAIDVVLDLQTPGGEIAWARDAAGRIHPDALLTSNASIYQSLRCGLAIADRVGREQPDWELAAGRVGHAVASHPERFADRSRWSMDWYYPVLGGGAARPSGACTAEGRLGPVRRPGARGALRRGPAVGDRCGDLRARSRARRVGREGRRSGHDRLDAAPA